MRKFAAINTTEVQDLLGVANIESILLIDMTELLIRFVLNAGALIFLIKFLYGKNNGRKDFYFSYFAIGITILLLCFLLENVKLELGFALGLFAIFGIIRYRTDAIPIKEMTYLFVVIGISVMNALISSETGYLQLILTNIIMLVALWGLEKSLLIRQESSLNILYEKIENINRRNEAHLFADLEERIGVKINRLKIENIDFLRDVANITIYYNSKDNAQATTTTPVINHNGHMINNQLKKNEYENH